MLRAAVELGEFMRVLVPGAGRRPGGRYASHARWVLPSLVPVQNSVDYQRRKGRSVPALEAGLRGAGANGRCSS